MVFGYLFLNGFLADSCFRVKDLGLDFAAGDGPVAYYFAVQEDDGPEVAGAVVCAVGMVGVEGDVAALVADEVFVVGGQQGYGAAAQSADAAVLMAEET